MSSFTERAAARFDGKFLNDVFFIEVFCGTSRLTACIRAGGLPDSFGVDHKIHKQAKSPVVKLDLVQDDQLDLLWSFVEDPACAGVHLAPPCGTSSRAREIVLGGRKAPRPLRNETFPDGLPSLQGSEKDRVFQANRLYYITGAIFGRCTQLGVPASVENPARSWMWETSFWLDGVGATTFYETCCHHCMYGSNRKKWTKFVHNFVELSGVSALCDGTHEHLPWGFSHDGNFSTSEETAYPWKLCKALSHAYAAAWFAYGAVGAPLELEAVVNQHELQLAQSYAYKQTRKRIPPLVKEFREIVVLQGPSSLLPVNKLDSDWTIPLQFKQNPEVKVLPSGSRMLRVQNTGGQAGPSEGNKLEKAAQFDASFDDTLEPDCEAVFGVPWSVDEFLERAASLVHPRNLHTGVPIELKDAIDWASCRSSCDMRNFRIGVIKEWLLLARDFNSAEKEIKLRLEPHVRNVLGQKRLKLFEHMLQQSGHGDVSLVGDIMKGFDIAGDIPKSAVFRKKFRPAELTVDSLRRNAKRVRRGILQSVHAEGDQLGSDHELARAVYDATMKELSLGYLHGPYAESDLGPECSITRRFGVRQGQKVRPIDNYTESQLNQTTTVHETITLHTADVIAAASSYRLGLTDCADRRTLKGKSWDLKRAYKQLPLSKRALQDSYLAVLNPKSLEVELFGQYVLPFGSTASVNSFGRLSYALWRIAVVCLRIHWTVFFDDFLCVEEDALCEHTQWVVDTFFRLTGWEISEDKEFPFGSEMVALGLVVDLSNASKGFFSLANTEKRKREVTEEIACVIKKGNLSANEALSLRGRLQFAESQICGRRSVLAMRAISRHASTGGGRLGTRLVDSLMYLKMRVGNMGPRMIRAGAVETLHVYVDACCEQQSSVPAGLGGVLIDPYEGTQSFYSLMLDEAQLQRFNTTGSQNPIFELECMAIFISLHAWRDVLRGKNLVVFTDNQAAQACFVKCFSENSVGMGIILASCEEEERMEACCWFERVNTASNVADSPSRNDTARFRKEDRAELMEWDEYVGLCELAYERHGVVASAASVA